MNRASRRKAKKTKKTPTVSQIFGEDFDRELELEQQENFEKAVKIFDLLNEGNEAMPHPSDFADLFDDPHIQEITQKLAIECYVDGIVRRQDEARFLASTGISVEKITELHNKYPYPFDRPFVAGWIQMAWNVENWKKSGIKEESPLYGFYLLFSALLSASGKNDFSNQGKGIREAGEVLAAAGGIALMMDAAEQCPESLQRVVDMRFDGIAGWMS